MFSVNNFYDIFNSHYGWPKKNSSVWVFKPHGSKNWLDLSVWGHCSDDLCHGAIIMHDQEPFFKEKFNDLKDDIVNNAFPDHTDSNWLPIRKYTVPVELVETLPAALAPLVYLRSTEIPIICHSEKNSSDIQFLSENMFIPCYYWWHGMVARDWFRHWEKHADLKVFNKAQAAYRFLFYCRATDGTREYREEIKERFNGLSILGSTDTSNPSLSATINVNDANTSGIHIVAETLFDTEKIYLTEKVFKPMVMAQPFILFSAPGSLQYLKEYGFKTFDLVWDESYDAITNHRDRKESVISLVRYLNDLPDDQFKSLYEKVLPIIEHNRLHFYSKEFQDYLWEELTNNMDAALTLREQLKESYPGGTDVYIDGIEFDKFNKIPSHRVSAVNVTIDHKVIKKEWVLRRYPFFRDLL